MEINIENFYIKKNDTLPPLKITVIDENCLGGKIPFDLTNVTNITFSMINSCGEFKIINKAAQIVSVSGGTIQYNWNSFDTDEAGIYDGEFKLFFSGSSGGIMSIPKNKSIKIFINNTINPY